MSSYEDLFQEWRTADRQAHSFEQLISRAALRALQGQGDVPTEEQRAKAHELRELANDLFQVSMAEMTARAHANKPTS